MGPVLFEIYIKNLPNEVQNDVYIFADDTKMYNLRLEVTYLAYKKTINSLQR